MSSCWEQATSRGLVDNSVLNHSISENGTQRLKCRIQFFILGDIDVVKYADRIHNKESAVSATRLQNIPQPRANQR